MNKRTVLVSQ